MIFSFSMYSTPYGSLIAVKQKRPDIDWLVVDSLFGGDGRGLLFFGCVVKIAVLILIIFMCDLVPSPLLLLS